MPKKNFIKNFKDISYLDYLLFGLTAVFCFLCFSHVDAATTAHNSTSYLNGHILDFYSGCHEINGQYGANYLPSTFILYAIWNLPLKLLSLLPNDWGVWSGAFTLWNKLLPTIFYFFSAYLISRLCSRRFNFSIADTKIAVILFITSPIGFYSQFIFGQYDIFTVFFMLLGLYYYFDHKTSRKSTLLCILYFAVAITFKYFALIIFLILTVLKEKKIWCIIRNTVLVSLPLLISGGIYYLFDNAAFTKSVLGFGALDYVQNSVIVIANFTNIQYAPVLIIILLAFAYFTKCCTQKELLTYTIFYCSGACFVLFGLMPSHPQWLLFATFFWNLGFLLHARTDVFLWIDIIFSIVFNLFIAAAYTHGTDQDLLKNGVFTSKLYYKENLNMTMKDIYPYNDTSMLFSILFAVMLIYFIFSHPRFAKSGEMKDKPKIVGLIRSRFYIGVLAFVIPALICLPSLVHQYSNLWEYESLRTEGIALNFAEYGEFTQSAIINGNSISQVKLDIGTYGETLHKSAISLTVSDSKGSVLKTVALGEDGLSDENLTFDLGIIPIENGEQYFFTFRAALGENEQLALFVSEYDGDKDIPLRTYQRHYENQYVTGLNKPIESSIIHMKILGDK